MKDKGIVSYGQHYLDNEKIQDLLVASAELDKKDVVIEIGAGDGRITDKIAGQAGEVFSYEIDKKTREVLEALCQRRKNVTVNFENFLTASLPKANKIVASLPYQITEPFVEKIKNIKDLERITLLVGKTFGTLADESVKHKTTKLLLLVKCYFCGEYIQDVASENFNPPPKTMSSIINLYPKAKADLIQTPELFIMRQLFEQRDKKIANALREARIRLAAARGEIMTKREAKAAIGETFDEEITDCYLEQMNNLSIEKLFDGISKLCR